MISTLLFIGSSLWVAGFSGYVVPALLARFKGAKTSPSFTPKSVTYTSGKPGKPVSTARILIQSLNITGKLLKKNHRFRVEWAIQRKKELN